MTDGGVARAHLETPEEIAAIPTDIEVPPTFTTARGKIKFIDVAKGYGYIVPDFAKADTVLFMLSNLLSPLDEVRVGSDVSFDVDAAGSVTRNIQLVTSGNEPEEGVTLANRDQWPHAKVVLLMVSVGGDDAGRSYEQFVADIKRAVVAGGVAKAATETGGYYIVNGKVCLPGDYDPTAKDFKDGAAPPSWAGGPVKAKTTAPSPAGDEPAPAQPVRARAKAAPTPVPDDASPAEAVRALAEGMNREVTGG